MPTAADTTEDATVRARNAEGLGPDTAVVHVDEIEPIERRRHERIQIYLRVRWEGLFGHYEGTLSDISAGGCFVLSEQNTTLRELIRLEVELHDGEWIKVWGEVTNQFPGVGFGVRYTEVEGEDEDKFALSLTQTKSIRAGVTALKRLSRSFVDEEGEDLPPERVDRQEYKRKVMLALSKVNRTLLDLPECQKKTALRLAVQTYADLYRVWAAMAAGAAGNPKEWVASYKCLKEKYAAPPHILLAFRDGDLPAALTYLRQKAHIYLTFVS
ncbi:MAG TPA: PilZ domain-containing protein [Pyrinomonadaceae bacterium]|nr:PilZ domain-containing protein [Pyrinomonadaceae bacterium]